MRLNHAVLWLARIRLILGSGLCAAVMYKLVWALHEPALWGSRAENWGRVLILCFAPLSVIIWSLLPERLDRAKTYGFIRGVIACHALTALALTIASGHIVWIILAVIGVLIDLLIVCLGPWGQPPENLRFFRYSILIANGGVVAGLFMWSFTNIGLVAWRAEVLSNGRPYCIHAAASGSGAYKTVKSLLDLRGLTLQAPYDRDLQFSFHAVLAIQSAQGIEWYNWSYRNTRFMPLTNEDFENALVGMREPQCERMPHFAKHLPFM